MQPGAYMLDGALIEIGNGMEHRPEWIRISRNEILEQLKPV